jgi:hypothetical protein
MKNGMNKNGVLKNKNTIEYAIRVINTWYERNRKSPSYV